MCFENSRKLDSQTIVAVKIIDVDSSDYELKYEQKDEAVKDFVNEISILHTLKDSQARNINNIHEAFTFYSQLWIVSDYCPGGSVHTLMKATKQPGLEERFIVAISRELAIAIKHVHDVGIIHRDVKAANVLITQEGQLQLCDFGVSGVLESNVAKRHTMIGTPFWMAPEMFSGESGETGYMTTGYGTEIDCWAFGCTVYELATGHAPNYRVHPSQLPKFLTKAPRLEGDEYSPGLRAFVSFCLAQEPRQRPSADAITKHPFVVNTSTKYPTSILRELIENFAVWEQSGGERASLFNPNLGAAGPEALEDLAASDDGWNFSTTDDFDELVYNQLTGALERENDDLTDGLLRNNTNPMRDMTPLERAQLDERALRGEQQMGRLFDPSLGEYKYESQPDKADLPLRSMSEAGDSVRESVIDLDLAMSVPEPQIFDAPTVRASRMSNTPFYGPEDDDGDDESSYLAQQQDQEPTESSKRDTMAWSFPVTATNENRKTMEWTFAAAANSDDKSASKAPDETLLSAPTGAKLAPAFRPMLKHTATAPPGEIQMINPREASEHATLSGSPDRSSMIDLDFGGESGVEIDPTYYSRPSTGYSSAAESSFTTDADDDPFVFDTNAQTIRRSEYNPQVQHRASLHTHSQSEPNRSSNPDFDEGYNYADRQSIVGHTRGSSYDDRESSLSRAPSVKASMDSLRHATDDEDEDSPEVAPHRAPFSHASYDLYETDTSSKSSKATVRPSTTKPPPIAYDNNNTVKRATFAPLLQTTNTNPNPTPTIFDRPRGRTGAHLTMGTRSDGTAYPLPHVKAAAIAHANAAAARDYAAAGRDTGKGHAARDSDNSRPLPFPEPVGPSAASLEEDASPEVVVAEMRRLLGDYSRGLGLAGSLLGNVRRRRGGAGG